MLMKQKMELGSGKISSLAFLQAYESIIMLILSMI